MATKRDMTGREFEVQDYTETPSEAAGAGVRRTARAVAKPAAELAKQTVTGYKMLGQDIAGAAKGFARGLTGAEKAVPPAGAPPVPQVAPPSVLTPPAPSAAAGPVSTAAPGIPTFSGTGQPVFKSSIVTPTRPQPSPVPAPAPAPAVAAAQPIPGVPAAAPVVPVAAAPAAAPAPVAPPSAVPAPVAAPAAASAAAPAGGFSQEMTSPAAVQLRGQFNANNMRARFGLTPGGTLRHAQLVDRWEEAGRQAYVNSLSEAGRNRFYADEKRRAMEGGERYRFTPEYIAQQLGTQRDVEVARQQGQAEALKTTIPAATAVRTEEMRGQREAARTQADREMQRESIQASAAEGAAGRKSTEKIASEKLKAATDPNTRYAELIADIGKATQGEVPEELQQQLKRHLGVKEVAGEAAPSPAAAATSQFKPGDTRVLNGATWVRDANGTWRRK